MRSGIVAVWDSDREYGEKVTEYLRRQGGLGPSVVWFHDLQKLQKAVECGQVAVAVSGEAETMPSTSEGTQWEESWMDRTPTVVLTQNRERMKGEMPTRETNQVELVGKEVSATTKRIYFYKYQPARQLLRLLSEIREQGVDRRGDEGNLASVTFPANSNGQPAWIRGIYSPFGGCLKTSLGLVMGCLLAEDRRCLFLSLEAHSGFRTLFGRQYPMDLSDLFAQIRQGEDPLGRLSEAMQPFGKLQYIPPVIWPVDVREAEFSELRELLQLLAMSGRFDEIILDVGQDLACPEKVLQLCDVIYQPVKDDVFSQSKLAEYETYLQVSGQESLCERTRKIQVSSLSADRDEMALDQWQRWEQMIPLVRQMLEEAGHEG